jgi:diaminopimelate epimerase
LKFTKWQGLGNDFIIPGEIGTPEDAPALAVKLCDRHFGIGADGLCVLEESDKADIRMRLFNSDGSEAEMCGNLMRCLPKYLYEAGICRKKDMLIETLAGVMKPRLLFSGSAITGVTVDMGAPKTKRGEIPIAGRADEEAAGIEITVKGTRFAGRGISMGNPHFVIFVPAVKRVDLPLYGPLIETEDLFPAKTNVQFAEVVARNKIVLRVWERGAGITLACGTGACAAAAAGMLDGILDEYVEVALDGGSLFVEWTGKNNSIFMTGPAEKVFDGEIYI